MKLGLSCRIHFLYTLITFLVADASQDGKRKALAVEDVERNECRSQVITPSVITVIDH